jgi:tetratricopeptide (TPR) repeat protein
MTRLITVAVPLLLGAAVSTAFAQSQAELAAKLNDEGKAAMYANNYADATSKFQQAVARVPEPKYFFNLCTSLFQEGKFDDALVACSAVGNNNPTPEQKGKAEKLTQRIKDEAKAQGITLTGTGGGRDPGGDPNNCAQNPQNPGCTAVPPPDPTCAQNPQDPRCHTAPPPDLCQQNPQDPRCSAPPPQHRVFRPPPSVYTAVRPNNDYTWTLGIDLYGGGGKIGQDMVYGTAAGGFRLKADYLLNRQSRVGAQGYFQLTHFNEDANNPLSGVNSLDVFDVGVAAYKHLCPSSAQYLCLTPLAGVQLALMSPNGAMDQFGSRTFDYAALGGRLELGLQFAFGSRQEHVLTGTIGVNLYSAVFADPSDPSLPRRSEVGLDVGGAFGYVGIGYTYRFNTPLGSSPFVTLE